MNLISNDVQITLKEITDMLNIEHNKAVKKVEKLAEEPEFGTVAKIDIVYNSKGQTIATFLLNKKQADKVKVILGYKNSKNISDTVYILKDGDYYKIGVSSGDASYRLMQCQIGNPRKISIIHQFELGKKSVMIEKILHSTYCDFNTFGEWFRFDSSQLKDIVLFLSNKIGD